MTFNDIKFPFLLADLSKSGGNVMVGMGIAVDSRAGPSYLEGCSTTIKHHSGRKTKETHFCTYFTETLFYQKVIFHYLI